MTLADILKGQIAQTGPMTLADYMSTCLLHPTHGYYTTRDPLGAVGDFITGPEVSQMFGELVGLSLAQSWIDQGSPAPFHLVELGPGRGTLMADILRATAQVPGFAAAAAIHLVEASPTLRAKQADLVPNAQYHDNLDSIPDGPLFLVANEFFDALPIRQFQRHEKGWCETVIGMDDDALTFGHTAPAPIALLDHRLIDTKPGDVVEVCPSLPSLIAEIGHRIGTHGGAALIIDYGDWGSQGDTFQALSDHTATDPLATPGQSDLTAHVDFEAIAKNAAPAAFARLTTQGVFLERLGITGRAQHLAGKLSGTALDQHIAAHRRLTHPDEMGHLFKVLALYPSGGTPPPGCDP